MRTPACCSSTPPRFISCPLWQVAESLNDLVEDLEDDVLRDAELEAAAPAAIAALRTDEHIRRQVAPLRPPRRRKLAH